MENKRREAARNKMQHKPEEATLLMLGQNGQGVEQFDSLLGEALEIADYMANGLGEQFGLWG